MTRSHLTIEVIRLIMEHYPTRWSAKEISTALGAPLRTVMRVLAELTETRLFAKKSTTYSLTDEIIHQLYGAQWYVRQEMNKDIKLHKGEKDAKQKRTVTGR